MVVKHLDVFLQMESDLAEHDIDIPPRPPTSTKADKVALYKPYEPASKEKERNELKEHDKNTDAQMRAPGGKKRVFNNLILDRKGPHDWRDTKNPNRDFPRLIYAAWFEPRLIQTYRANLLEKSSAAAFLRTSLHQLLSSYAKPRQIIKPGSRKFVTVRRYDFVDGIKSPSAPLPEVDVNMILTTLTQSQNLRDQLGSLKALIKKIESAPYALARPDVNILAAHIKSKIDELLIVSHS